MNAHQPAGISHPWDAPPEAGQVVEVADGILWARLPLPMRLDHVNIYAMDDGDGWTLVDTGLNWSKGRAEMDALLAGPLSGKPVHRVLLTHHHPDHIGLIGWFSDRGAEVLASRTAWLLGRMLTLDSNEVHPPEAIDFRRRAGVNGPMLEAFSKDRPFNFADCVSPIPSGFRSLADGTTIAAGGRDWTIRFGNGHAPDHVTLWSGGLLIAGDQVLPGISPNIGVYPTEPEADPLTGWLETCSAFRKLAKDPLVLTGHKLPFRGLDFRLEQLVENHLSAFDRIEAALREAPLTALQLLPVIFRREIEATQLGLALAEAVAHTNHLHQAGRLTRALNTDGAWEYQVTE